MQEYNFDSTKESCKASYQKSTVEIGKEILKGFLEEIPLSALMLLEVLSLDETQFEDELKLSISKLCNLL